MYALVTGASGSIGRALVDTLQRDSANVLALTRGQAPETESTATACWLEQCSAEQYRSKLSPQLSQQLPDVVFHCSGILHDGSQMPEKSLKQFSAEKLALP